MIQHITLRNSGGGRGGGGVLTWGTAAAPQLFALFPRRPETHSTSTYRTHLVKTSTLRKEGREGVAGGGRVYIQGFQGRVHVGGGLGQQSQVTGCFHGTMVHSTPKHKSKKHLEQQYIKTGTIGAPSSSNTVPPPPCES